MELYQEQLLSLLGKALFGRESEAVLTDEILQEARLQTVSSLISKDEYAVMANNMLVDAAHAALTETLKGIPFVTIKGYASASYYPDPLLRQMGDVDFYVEAPWAEEAERLLLGAGFKPTRQEHERHNAYVKNKITYELHTVLKGMPNEEDGIPAESQVVETSIRDYFSDVIDSAKRVRVKQGEIIIPNEFHHGLIMLLHVAAHLMNDGGIGLRHLCDWATYVDKVDVSLYRERLKKVGLWTFACQLTATCIKYLGLRKMNWVEPCDGKLLDELIEDVMKGGNFGRKEDNRSGISHLTEDDNVLRALAKMTQRRFPVVKRIPLLLPGAMAWWAIRHCLLQLFGKRQGIHVSDVKKRKDFCKQFKLFVLE
ncbi:MAG: nucleotidyltransferase family protein [Acetatifactor sp.]|nr:nucleotidyltransferase family protein [Acetatifactor sp.]